MPLPSNAYLEFWSLVLGVPADDLLYPGPQVSHQGRYLAKRGPDRIFLWRDLVGGKVVVAADPSFGEPLVSSFAELGLTEEFDDFDYGWIDGTRPVLAPDPSVHRLAPASAPAVAAFSALCSEDEIDTLDLDLEADTAFGVLEDGQLTGIGRSAPISGTSLSDLTVVVRPDVRNRGIASALVAQLLLDLDTQGRVPKYRVSTTNIASQKVAERVGLVRLSRLTVFGEA